MKARGRSKNENSFRFWTHLFVYIAILVVFYFEVITYSLLPFQWIKQPTCKSPKCKKILFVADPQIIGSQIRGHDVVNFLAKWDSDRYISRTFLQAYYYLKPEVVVFLGDIMDQGHISSDEEFFYDLKRFLNIFQFSSILNNVQKILLPGDNDIGGIDDIMLPQVVHRFNKIFNQSEGPLSFENIQFYKINFMTYEIQEPNYVDVIANDDSNIRIAVSHVPLLPNPTQFLQRVVRRIRPHLIFSGHAHVSTHFLSTETDIWKRKYTNILPNETEVKTYKIRSGMIHEFVVPTCSYRMGVNNMGYGAAFIDTQDNVLQYIVLWLPKRFVHLSAYLVIVFISSFLFFVSVFACLIRKITRLFCRICSKPIASSYYHLP